MMELELETIAKYPFLKGAKGYVASLNLTLWEIQNHPVYSSAIGLGRQRVLGALNGKISVDLSDKISQELTILSYVTARIFANLTGNRRLIFRYAKTEAKTAYEFLKKEGEDVLRMIKEDIDFRIDENMMDFTHYLKLTKNLTDPRWGLVNRIMSSGRVEISRYESLELLREAIGLRIMEPIDVKNVPEEFRKIAGQLIEVDTGAPREIKIKELDKGAIPPCISRMLMALEAGDLSHNSMFIIGTFFVGLGLKVDDVVRIFSVSPKFNEEKSRYQLEFLAGEKSNTKYSCPTCAKIKSYGLCASDCGIKHPLQYYRDHIKV
jgi:DNA primase large subunit